MLRRAIDKWKQYRYRFVPWIALNLKDRSVRAVPSKELDKILPDKEVGNCLHQVFEAFDANKNIKDAAVLFRQNLIAMEYCLGFQTERQQSILPAGGTGVFITAGLVKEGTVVSMYPGTIYQPSEPVFFQSLGNPFIFRCIDSILIDGNDKNLSKSIYKSCCQRDRIGPYMSCDMSWLTAYPKNPLAVGQYVNNQSKQYPANVAYQEFDVPLDFPFHLLQYVPNAHYTSAIQAVENGFNERVTRVVVLVSLRDIAAGEELFSSYFTVVQ